MVRLRDRLPRETYAFDGHRAVLVGAARDRPKLPAPNPLARPLNAVVRDTRGVDGLDQKGGEGGTKVIELISSITFATELT